MDPIEWLGKQLEGSSPDLLREMLAAFVAQLMGAEVDAICGAGYGERSVERVNSRNGYRAREWDTRAGTIELAIPKLRSGSYFPDWLLDRRRRAEQALISVIATSYLLGVSTRRVDKLVQTLGIEGISKSQVSRMAKILDARWRRSGPARWTPARTPTCGSTRSPTRSVRVAGWCRLRW
jgi:transposase-like protein